MEKYDFKLIPMKIYGVETGKHAKCSPQHYDVLIKYDWRIDEFNGGYPVTTGYLNKQIRMHKFVMAIIEKIEIPEGYLIDHIDTTDPDNQLNNCLNNLRLLTPAQNTRNRRKRKNILL